MNALPVIPLVPDAVRRPFSVTGIKGGRTVTFTFSTQRARLRATLALLRAGYWICHV